jgi:hypothetical protein
MLYLYLESATQSFSPAVSIPTQLKYGVFGKMDSSQGT